MFKKVYNIFVITYFERSNVGLPIKSAPNNSNGIHIAFNKNGKASGEAYVQFVSVESMNQALKRNMEKLGHR